MQLIRVKLSQDGKHSHYIASDTVADIQTELIQEAGKPIAVHASNIADIHGNKPTALHQTSAVYRIVITTKRGVEYVLDPISAALLAPSLGLK